MIVRSNGVSRRGLLRVVGAAGLVAGSPIGAFAASTEPLPAGAMRFRSLSVDTQPLVDKGLPGYAARIAKMAEPILASEFAQRLAPSRSDAPRLVLRIDSITLGPEGGESMPLLKSNSRDWISGAGEVIDAHGKVLRVEPVETSTDAFFRGGGDILAIENIRTERLIAILAEWVDRYV